MVKKKCDFLHDYNTHERIANRKTDKPANYGKFGPEKSEKKSSITTALNDLFSKLGSFTLKIPLIF
jgi:hypothetical protein